MLLTKVCLLIFLLVKHNEAVKKRHVTSNAHLNPNALFFIAHPEEKTNFFTAVNRCYSLRMELASIDGAEENMELVQSIESVQQSQISEFWIGGTNIADRSYRKYIWYPSQKHFAYSNLNISHPDTKHCVKFMYSPINSIWQNEDCFKELRFICKKSSYSRFASDRSLFDYVRDGGKQIGSVFQWAKNMIDSAATTTGDKIKNSLGWVKEKLVPSSDKDSPFIDIDNERHAESLIAKQVVPHKTKRQISKIACIINNAKGFFQNVANRNMNVPDWFDAEYDKAMRFIRQHFYNMAWYLSQRVGTGNSKMAQAVRIFIRFMDNIINGVPPTEYYLAKLDEKEAREDRPNQQVSGKDEKVPSYSISTCLEGCESQDKKSDAEHIRKLSACLKGCHGIKSSESEAEDYGDDDGDDINSEYR